MNPMEILKGFANKGGNPQQLLQKAMGMTGNSNNMITNLINLSRKGEKEKVEQIARNMCNEMNINFDEDFPKFMALFKNGSFAKQHK